MAAGNMIFGTAVIAASATYDIKPSNGTDEWDIHNIYFNGQCKLSIYDGTNLVDFDTPAAMGSRQDMTSHVKSVYYIRVTNTGSSTINIAYDGMQTA